MRRHFRLSKWHHKTSIMVTYPVLARPLPRPPMTTLHAASPRPIQQHGNKADQEKQAAYAGADDVEMVAHGGDAIPQGSLGVGDVLDEREQLDDADEGGDEDCDGAEDDLVVQEGDGVAGEGSGGVEGEHGGAV
ncbi:hypothetical protein E4U21_005619 [Claviceps maximensis]|nr:hypothetical protein E4U21_005619 [Claviceps maximensis]